LSSTARPEVTGIRDKGLLPEKKITRSGKEESQERGKKKKIKV